MFCTKKEKTIRRKLFFLSEKMRTKKNRKIGLLGGTFDPIHNGHLMIAEYAYRQFELDEIWFLPNGNPPHKANPDIKKDVQARVEMVQIAIESFPYFKLNTYESEKSDKSYSCQTLQHFKETYPEYQFYFIIGADSLQKIETWKCPEVIIQSVTILAAYRDDMDTPEEMNQQIEYLNQKYHGDIKLLKTPLLDVASHEIRQAIQNGKIEDLKIPENVLQYILRKKLYNKE